MTKLESHKTKPQKQWEAGKKYKCILSKSPGYKVGQEYACYKNKEGFLCLKGSDGFEDFCSMLVSCFEAAKEV